MIHNLRKPDPDKQGIRGNMAVPTAANPSVPPKRSQVITKQPTTDSGGITPRGIEGPTEMPHPDDTDDQIYGDTVVDSSSITVSATPHLPPKRKVSKASSMQNVVIKQNGPSARKEEEEEDQAYGDVEAGPVLPQRQGSKLIPVVKEAKTKRTKKEEDPYEVVDTEPVKGPTTNKNPKHKKNKIPFKFPNKENKIVTEKEIKNTHAKKGGNTTQIA